MKKIKILVVSLLFGLAACQELDLAPEDSPSDATFFSQESDYFTYSNGLYGGVLRNLLGGIGGVKWGSFGVTSDYWAASDGPSDGLLQHSSTGVAASTSGTWNTAYTNIRNVNYMLDRRNNIGVRSDAVNQYIGEAFYARAHHYFTLLQNFGGVPFIGSALDAEDPELFSSRESRNKTAGRIIQDLDSAILLLQWMGGPQAPAGRFNKESALTMKTRVGLYEGSWEFYHGRKGSAFAVSGEDGTSFLQEAIEAGDELIAEKGSNIYVGESGWEYTDLFNQNSYASVPGAFLWREYDNALGISSGTTRPTADSQGLSFTQRGVDAYLMLDGQPEDISSVTFDFTDQSSVVNNRDPRCGQSVYSPSRGTFTELFPFLVGVERWENTIFQVQTDLFSTVGGFFTLKGAVRSTIALDANDTDDLILRYGEVLLNYAEAKAILGNITQADLDKTVNVLRDRVGFVHMDLAQVNGWSTAYLAEEGFDPSADNILNEIRRERNVELMLEGFRQTDTKRWAIFEDVYNGYKPAGTYFQEIKDYFDDDATLLAAGLDQGAIDGAKLEVGVNIEVDDETGMYINPLFRFADFAPGSGTGYFIEVTRDYLSAIPANEIQFYLVEEGVTLEQNPGWQ